MQQFFNEEVRVYNHTDPYTTYKQTIKSYIGEARSKGPIPIVCSSIVRRHFDSVGNLKDTYGDYIKAARVIARETNSPFIGMEAKTRKLVTELGREKSKSLFLYCRPEEYITRPNGVQDSTHLNNYGAHQVASLFVDGVKELKLPLVSFLK